MKETDRVVVLVTVADEQEGRSIAEVLLNRRKAACVNIVPKVNSIFWWQGKLDSAQESLLIIKTRASLLPEIVRIVRKTHSYDVPEIIALPIVGGNEDYLKWIDNVVEESQVT